MEVRLKANTSWDLLICLVLANAKGTREKGIFEIEFESSSTYVFLEAAPSIRGSQERTKTPKVETLWKAERGGKEE